MREPMEDLLERAVGWYEPPPELMDAVSARVRRRARRQRSAAAAVAAAVFLLGGVLVFRAFSPSDGTAVGDQDYGTYVLSDFRVGPAIDPRTDEEIPGRALVEYQVTWSTSEYPGEHLCELTVFDAGGRQVGSLEFQQASMMPDPPGGSSIEVDVNGTPTSAAGSCGPERIDTPVAYLISDPIVVPAAHADAGIAVAFHVAWPDGLGEGGFPGPNACFIEVVAPDGEVFARQFFTLAVGPGRIEQDVWLGSEKRSAILGQDLTAYSATVRCEPYTAAHAEPPVTEPTNPPGAIEKPEPTVSVTRCIQATTSGDFDGDGTTDDAEFFEIVSGSVSCDRGGEVFGNLSSQEVVIQFGSDQTLEQPFTDCQGGLCAYVFEAADLDGDGRDELAVDVSSGGALGLVEFYRVDPDGIRPLVIADPGDPPYVDPGPAILGGGFDSGLQSPIVCRVTDDGARELVSIHAQNVGDSLSGPWEVHETTMVLRNERLVVTSTNDSEASFPGTSGIPSFSRTAPLDSECS